MRDEIRLLRDRLLFVAPRGHHAQIALAEMDTDEAFARRHGAEWVPGLGVMRATAAASDEDARVLFNKFGTKVARKARNDARGDILPAVSRLTMAKAALDEMTMRGLKPNWEIPSAEVEEANRRYFYVVQDPASPYSQAGFEAKARANNIAYAFEVDKTSPAYGLPYVDESADLSESLRVYTAPQARAAHAQQVRRGAESRALLAGASLTFVAADKNYLFVPLVPNEHANVDSAAEARAHMSRIPAAHRQTIAGLARAQLEITPGVVTADSNHHRLSSRLRRALAVLESVTPPAIHLHAESHDLDAAVRGPKRGQEDVR